MKYFPEALRVAFAKVWCHTFHQSWWKCRITQITKEIKARPLWLSLFGVVCSSRTGKDRQKRRLVFHIPGNLWMISTSTTVSVEEISVQCRQYPLSEWENTENCNKNLSFTVYTYLKTQVSPGCSCFSGRFRKFFLNTWRGHIWFHPV